ncbi:MAG: CHAP domain-containing protein, partial [Clostridia bacterium]|nr:CHAP domain-containing protein [Clostridia bacterium]
MGFPTEALTMTYEPSAAYKSSKYYTALCNVQLTGDQRTDIVNIALSQEGYYEGNNLSQLNGMTKGANDYTEYGYWYSKSHPNYAWCAIFINWCARQAGIPTSVISTSALAAEGNLVKNYYAYSSTANIQPGDLLHIKNSYGNHVAMVYAVDSENIYSIEGNMSDMVRKSYYKRKTGYAYYGSSEYIGYYAKPSYTSVTLEGESTLMLSNPVYPSGNYPTMKSFGLSGTFISNYPITTVSAYVYNKDNVAVQIYETNWSSTTYDIAKNGVDANMIFGDLPTNSNYTYTVSATDLSGKTVSKSSSFSIGDPTKQPPASTLTLTSPVGPSGVFATMRFFGLSGTFTSNYKIINVKAWISDDTGKALQSYSVNWNSTTYNIAKNGVDDNMVFGTLPTNANYTYNVQATDVSGKT